MAEAKNVPPLEFGKPKEEKQHDEPILKQISEEGVKFDANEGSHREFRKTPFVPVSEMQDDEEAG